jgi:dTMP kinase
MQGLFITFEGTEGGGKSTQIRLLAERLHDSGHGVRTLREPGGTPIGEEIRHTLKHSEANYAMTPEAELLLMNASRAQLVREIIRPALAAGVMVLCDRFFDSTTAYQGWGRQIDLARVRSVIDFAVEQTRPDLTLLLHVPLAVSEARRLSRQAKLLDVPVPEVAGTPPKLQFVEPLRDRMEEADRAFFERVQRGFDAIAKEEPGRVRVIDATQSIAAVATEVWKKVSALMRQRGLAVPA